MKVDLAGLGEMDLGEIGAIIKSRRIEANISQADLAGLSGVSRATIVGLETGQIKEIGFRRLGRIIGALRNCAFHA